MAKYFKCLILFIGLLFSSCQEGHEAGDLLGQWKMTNSDSQYLAFSGSVAAFRCSTQNRLENEVFGNFQHTGDSLFIQCQSIEGSPADTTTVEHRFGFTPFSNIRVKIVALDGDRLVLSKDNQTWNFDKY